MRLDDNTYEFIKKEVIDLFERFNIMCIPISGFELATKMGMTLIPYSLLSPKKLQVALQVSKDGFYMEPGDGKEYICYNDYIEYKRCNMTILHEIGHAVLGHTESTVSEVSEAEAAFFAKYAVAPPPLIHRFTPKTPEEIADLFCISYEASINAWNYYCLWKKIHNAQGRFTAYEIKLNKLYEIESLKLGGDDN